MHADEVQAGVELLKKLLATTHARIDRISLIPNREAHLFIFARNESSHQIPISDEFLSDLKGTKEYQRSATDYFRDLENRLLNASPLDFYALSGIPLNIKINWPFEAMPGRAASAVQVHVRDLRRPDAIAIVAVYVTEHQLLELMADPFIKERCIVNTMRSAIDKNGVTFFPKKEHPTELSVIKLQTSSEEVQSEEALQEFLLGKIYWLGFKRRERRTPVFIADRWDANYLGVDLNTLIQTAQVLEAQDMISLDSSQEFASAARGLLVRAKPSESATFAKGTRQLEDQPDWNPRPLWDAFICHASEDKEDFVKPLAQALKQKGLRVWYDEFELKLGDSLRRSIDRGLRDSRFGVVVLSHAFFAKEWPQRELDGLAAKEIDGGKVILPVWHKITRDQVLAYSPMLADRMAVSTAERLEAVVQKILDVIVER